MAGAIGTFEARIEGVVRAWIPLWTSFRRSVEDFHANTTNYDLLPRPVIFVTLHMLLEVG
jgi:hypothetical protein